MVNSTYEFDQLKYNVLTVELILFRKRYVNKWWELKESNNNQIIPKKRRKNLK